MAAEYDKILRENFQTPKTNLLRQLIPAAIISIEPIIPKLRHTILEKETDTVAEVVTDDGKNFIVHIEWQSTNDYEMARRMALYDLLLYETYGKEVMGMVLYVGNDKLRMTDSLNFFGFHYSCRMLDVRLLNPDTFLQSDDAGEVIFAILTGNGGEQEKLETIRQIFSKLQLLFADDTTLLRTKIKQLELLSLPRGKDIQNIIIKEEQKMPVVIDIKQDARYQQGVEEGVEQGVEKKAVDTAQRLFKKGFDILFVQEATDLPLKQLEEIQKSIFTK